MATLDKLVGDRRVVPYRLAIHDDRLPERLLYLAPSCVTWLQVDLPAMKRDRSKVLEPIEQVMDAFNRYVTDKGLTGVGEWVNIKPQGKGVYEIKTTDVRVLGWFWRPRQFVAVCGDSKENCKTPGTMTALIAEVVSFRASLGLEPPPFRRHKLNVRELL